MKPSRRLPPAQKSSNLWLWLLCGGLFLLGMPMLMCAGCMGLVSQKIAAQRQEPAKRIEERREDTPQEMAKAKPSRIRFGMREGTYGDGMVVERIARGNDGYTVYFRWPQSYIAHFDRSEADALKRVRIGDRIGIEGRCDDEFDEVEKGVERTRHFYECKILLIQQEAGRERNGNVILRTTYRAD